MHGGRRAAGKRRRDDAPGDGGFGLARGERRGPGDSQAWRQRGGCRRGDGAGLDGHVPRGRQHRRRWLHAGLAGQRGRAGLCRLSRNRSRLRDARHVRDQSRADFTSSSRCARHATRPGACAQALGQTRLARPGNTGDRLGERGIRDRRGLGGRSCGNVGPIDDESRVPPSFYASARRRMACRRSARATRPRAYFAITGRPRARCVLYRSDRRGDRGRNAGRRRADHGRRPVGLYSQNTRGNAWHVSGLRYLWSAAAQFRRHMPGRDAEYFGELRSGPGRSLCPADRASDDRIDAARLLRSRAITWAIPISSRFRRI